MSNNVYAVRVGRIPGIYKTWDECEAQTKAFSGAKYKKFKTMEEAEKFVEGVAVDRSTFPSEDRPPPKKSTGTTGSSSGSMDSFDDYQPRDQPKRSYPFSQPGGKKNFLCKTSPTRVPFRRFTTLAMGTSSTSGEKFSDSVRFSKHLPEKTAVVYTDGCCTNNGREGAVAGIGVFWGEDSPYNIAEPLPGRPTNNRAEIHAAVTAVKQARSLGMTKIVINTDSRFLIDSMTQWMPGWLDKNWKLGGGGQVVNRLDFEALLDATKDIEVEWNHVRAHQGIFGNEEADRLANEGARKELPNSGIAVVNASGSLWN